jgi:SAM-dependent methyltransferase
VQAGRPRELEGSGVTYDLIFLVGGLEHFEAPIDELGSLRRLLRPGGRLLVVTSNASSAAWRLFRGRHWAGYDFPRHRCLFSPATVQRLASETGFVIERLGSQTDQAMWTHSASNFARDWAAPPLLRRFGTIGFAAVGMLEAALSAFGFAGLKGSHLKAVLRRPVGIAA